MARDRRFVDLENRNKVIRFKSRVFDISVEIPPIGAYDSFR